MLEQQPTSRRRPDHGPIERSYHSAGIIVLAVGVTLLASLTIVLVAYGNVLNTMALPSPAIALLLLAGFVLFILANRRQ